MPLGVVDPESAVRRGLGLSTFGSAAMADDRVGDPVVLKTVAPPRRAEWKTGTMTDTRATVLNGLRLEIERGGYYPTLVAEAVESVLAGEAVDAYVVHQETTLDQSEIRRHVTVLVLTPTRLIVGHTDEHGADDTSSASFATTSTEAVRLDRIGSVVVTRTVAHPERHSPGAPPAEVVLSIGWGAVGRIDIEPASCSDPNCEADHGYTGSFTADDLSLRVSAAAEGPEVVARTVGFAAALSAATARR